MEKHLIKWSYWLGVVSAVIALVWRALTAFGVLHMEQKLIPGVSVWYASFMKAAVLFLLISIASYCYSASQKS